MIGTKIVTPAALTKTSIFDVDFRTVERAEDIDDVSDTSTIWDFKDWEFRGVGFRSHPNTRKFLDSRSSTVFIPKPEDDPVTIATFCIFKRLDYLIMEGCLIV
jgi:hypothetical protein